MRLSLEVKPAGEGRAEVHLYMDEAGRQALKAALDGLRWPDWEHEHLFSPEWAGDALTLERTSGDAAFVDNLTLYLRPDRRVGGVSS